MASGDIDVLNRLDAPTGSSTGLTDTQLRASAVPVSVASIPSHAVTNAGTFAVQVSSAPTTAVTGPLTDTQLRATAVPVSGTVSTGGLTDTQLRATAVPVSGTVTMSNPTAQGLTDTQLRATAVPISLATAPTTPVTGTFFQTTQPVSMATAPTTPVTGTFFQTTQPTIDANKQAVIFYAQILNATTTITPTAGKRIKLVKAQVLQSPDNTAANPVTLSFVSTGNFSTGWAYSDSCEATGAINEVLNITLGNTQPVSINIRYKEI